MQTTLPKMYKIISIVIICLVSLSGFTQELDVKKWVQEADEKMRGTSSKSNFSMTIERPGWSRTVKMKSWTIGNKFSLMYITSPAKEKGQVFLKRANEMWNWIPSIERMVKIPPSMMMQSWMGSDFTNDDLVKESSLAKDYTHKLAGEEKIQGYECYKIELIPNEEAPVVWGKIYMWISKKEKHWLRAEYFDEDNYLVKYEVLSDIKMVDDRMMPTRLEMIPADEENKKTILIYGDTQFNISIKESFFSIQNMKRVR
ncbi:outer membrane lipoprotein-sorting protein [Labilibaculum sp. DW002]|uniref:Outer membrane lipoprotein-sorting protein n=1 Tax=Paralabilibaculum antarcticum TaxID=2912572 RepID=A0ABT5VSG9_9BACT|nr:outer membrane lipoprotein-sorting protein [Labilibaculum sp. DW002]MDE5418372.1 outer membrane lipoprotein-sorting protein [Labilibaculum sp. DW002]